jgi:hypothetical protein
MRKLLIGLLLAIVLVGTADAQMICRSSGLKTADASIIATYGTFCGVEIISDGTNDATVVVYDNASSASGTEVFKGKVAAANNFGGGFTYSTVSNGIYVDVTGTGAAYIVFYK